MRHFTVAMLGLASLLLGPVPHLTAQQDFRGVLLDCGAIENDIARLGCLDGLVMSLGAEAEGTQEPPAEPDRPWETITHEEYRALHDKKVKPEGLHLTDVGKGFFQAMAGQANGVSKGFSIRVFTPVNWVAHLFSEAERDYSPITWEDLEDRDIANVLRVRAYPDSPTSIHGERGNSVRHVVLRHPDKKKRETIIVQPLSKSEFTESLQTSGGADLAFFGVEALFSMDALEAVRDQKGEWLVTVIGEGGEDGRGEEKNYKVKTKHLDDLGLR